MGFKESMGVLTQRIKVKNRQNQTKQTQAPILPVHQKHKPQICFTVLQELSELVARTDQKIRLAVQVDDQIDRLKENGIFCVWVLHFFRLWRFLCFVKNGLKALCQSVLNSWIIWHQTTHTHSMLRCTEELNKNQVIITGHGKAVVHLQAQIWP